MNQHLERLDQLAPCMQDKVRQWISECQLELGGPLLLVHSYRSAAHQMLIWQKGRTFDREAGAWLVSSPKDVVTQAKPGQSAHNVVDSEGRPAAMAVDVIPLDPRGIALWSYNNWTPIYEVAKRHGLDPYGDPEGAYLPSDQGHVEYPNWKACLESLGLRLPRMEQPSTSQV